MVSTRTLYTLPKEQYATSANPENPDPNGGVCSKPKDQVGVDFDADLKLNLFASLDQENGGPNLLKVPIYVSFSSALYSFPTFFASY